MKYTKATSFTEGVAFFVFYFSFPYYLLHISYFSFYLQLFLLKKVINVKILKVSPMEILKPPERFAFGAVFFYTL